MNALNQPESANPGSPAGTEIENSNNTSSTDYKKLSNKKHCCSFACGWCELLGRSIVEQKYRDFGNILLEDDLSYDIFGRNLVK